MRYNGGEQARVRPGAGVPRCPIRRGVRRPRSGLRQHRGQPGKESVITRDIAAAENVRIVLLSSALQPPDWRERIATWSAGVRGGCVTTFRARGVELCREILGLARGANCRALRVWISKRGGGSVATADTADWDLRGSNRTEEMAKRGWPHLLRYRQNGHDGIEVAGACVGRWQSE